MKPTKRSGLLGVVATCSNCDWTAESKNAAGIAQQHAARTGHEVHVEQTIGVIYNSRSA